jgi:hypothetical protein
MDITLTGDTLSAVIEFEPDMVCGQAVICASFVVKVEYVGVIGLDRRGIYAISTGKSRKLAERLVNAVNAGKAFGRATTATDVNGKTYINAPFMFSGRRLNADLKRAGF